MLRNMCLKVKNKLKVTLELLLLTSAVTLFVWQIKDVVGKFFDGRTTIAMREETEPVLFFPALNIFSDFQFKEDKLAQLEIENEGFGFLKLPVNQSTGQYDYFEAAYLLNRDFKILLWATFENGTKQSHDLKVGTNVVSWKNNKTLQINVYEVVSHTEGLYYSIHILTPAENDVNYFPIDLVDISGDRIKRRHNVAKFQIIVADASERYRLFLNDWHGVNKLHIKPEPGQPISISITKQIWKSLSQEGKELCNTYHVDDSATRCFLKRNAQGAKNVMDANCSRTCTNPPVSTMMSLVGITDKCHSVEEAICMYHAVSKGWSDHSCPIPCIKTEYLAKIESLTFDGLANVTYFNIQYDTMKVKVFDELLIFDLSSFIGNVGGSLGLFIGFSYFQFAKRLSNTIVDYLYKTSK